jgi:hypothetical protein
VAGLLKSDGTVAAAAIAGNRLKDETLANA